MNWTVYMRKNMKNLAELKRYKMWKIHWERYFGKKEIKPQWKGQVTRSKDEPKIPPSPPLYTGNKNEKENRAERSKVEYSVAFVLFRSRRDVTFRLLKITFVNSEWQHYVSLWHYSLCFSMFKIFNNILDATSFE